MNVTRAQSPAVSVIHPRVGSSKSDVEVSYNPQDSVVFAPEVATLPGVGKGLSGPRAELSTPIQPNGDGQYVFEQGDSRIHAALPFAAVSQTIGVWEEALGHPIKWAFDGEKLGIVPDGGDMLNAYYTREEADVNFFHATDPKTHQKIYSGDSGEVVSHETGHAILDSLRPGYFSAWSPDPAAFHEAFGDVSAMIMSLRNDRVLDKVVAETGGDLSKNNSVAAMGEQIGIAINHTAGKNATGGDYTRNAINDFKWSDPSELPENGGPNTLGSEAHSFSRLWTGASYDILKGIVDRNMEGGMAPKEALRAGGRELLTVYANLFKTAPKGDFTFREMAQAMIKADQQYNDGKNVDLMNRVFTDRNILGTVGFESEGPKAHVELTGGSAAEGTKNIRVALNGNDYGMFNGAVVESPVDQDGSLTKSAEVGARVQASLKKLIAAGRIKYTEPNQPVTKKDLFDSQGRPYAGVVRWQDGRMTIERVKIAS
jgi:hypothetical protein